jgi:hypothetical protein
MTQLRVLAMPLLRSALSVPLLLKLRSFFMELVKDCGWREKCFISVVCKAVRDGRGAREGKHCCLCGLVFERVRL